MIVVTSENIVGHRIVETLGQVFGVVVRSHAIDRLVMNAKLMGADGVVMMRFDSGEIGQTMNEVVAYGTAVRLERE